MLDALCYAWLASVGFAILVDVVYKDETNGGFILFCFGCCVVSALAVFMIAY